MKTTNYDISVDAADLLEDAEAHELPESMDADALNIDDALAEDDSKDDFSRHDDRVTLSRHDDSATSSSRHDDAPTSSVEPLQARRRMADSPASLPRLHGQPSTLSVIEADDLDWVSRLIDVVAACRGQPWRVALERLDAAQYLDRPIPPIHFAATIGALQRVLGGGGRKAQLARTCREIVLGHPALSAVTRTDRVAAAARALNLSCDDVERLLWADLPRERPVELPFGRPSELEVAAFANVHLIQRAVRRAQTITITVSGDAGPLLRGAQARGLLTTVTVIDDPAPPAPALAKPITTLTMTTPLVTLIEVVGPLSLCHRTAVYGRAIASLVPLLAECRSFELTLLAHGVMGPYRSHLASPTLLPMTPAKATSTWSVAARLAKQLRRERPATDVVLAPPPIRAEGSYVCPDIVIGDGQLYVEIVGFWTAEYVERKRALYAAAGLDVVLCVDETRGCSDDSLPRDVIGFSRHVDAATIVARLGH